MSRRRGREAMDRALGGLVAAGAALRFATLDVQSFWLDEAVTVTHLDGDVSHLAAGIEEREGTPPLYYALAWLWTRVSGTGEVGVRSLSALIGTLAIPVAFALASRLGGRRAGLAAAALVAFNPFLVWYAQEARAYILLAVLVGAATLLWLRALEQPGRRTALAWGAVAALALLTHYFAAFVLVPQAVVLLWRCRGAAPAGVALPAVAGIALVPLLVAQRDARVDWIGEIPLHTRVLDLPKHWMAGPFGSPVDLAVAVAAVVVGAGAVAAVRLEGPERRRALLVAGAALAGIALPVVLAAGGLDYFMDRYLVASLLPLLCVAAAGLVRLRAGVAAVAAASALFAAFAVMGVADPELRREDWRRAAGWATAGEQPAALVTPPAGDPPLEVYLPGAGEPATGIVRVREIVAIAPWRFGRPRPATPTPPPGFEIAERAEWPTLTLVRFRAATATDVTPGALAAITLASGDPAVARVAG